MEKGKRLLVFSVVMIILLFAAVVVMAVIYFRQGAQCVANPFSYGAKQGVKNLPETNLICQCSVMSPNKTYSPFWFDKNGIHQGNMIGDSLNISKESVRNCN